MNSRPVSPQRSLPPADKSSNRLKRRMTMKNIQMIALFLLLFVSPSAEASNASLSKIGIGLSTNGGQIQYRLTPNTLLQAGYMTAHQEDSLGLIRTDVYNFRWARHKLTDKIAQPYWGAETAYISSKQKSTSRKAKGYAAGFFVGLDFKIKKSLSVAVDTGPYYMSLKTIGSKEKEDSLQFVMTPTIRIGWVW